jgi:hypothetical protein
VPLSQLKVKNIRKIHASGDERAKNVINFGAIAQKNNGKWTNFCDIGCKFRKISIIPHLNSRQFCKK